MGKWNRMGGIGRGAPACAPWGRCINLLLHPANPLSFVHQPCPLIFIVIALLLAFLTGGCAATAVQIIPTQRPTVTETLTPTPSRTPGVNITPTAYTPPPVTMTGGPTPTSLFGATSTALPGSAPTTTRVPNPNAPRIEFFTADVVAVAPGESLTLFWSTRGVGSAVIYRVDRNGVRNQLWNVAPDGSLIVGTRGSDRGTVDFVLSVGEGALNVEQGLSLPLACPIQWFFQPAPDACPESEAQITRVIEEPFERGRMLYIEVNDQVYALFNDGQAPAWVTFPDRYDPAIHPELEESFVPPPGLVQPLAILGFVWRGNDVVRNRLGLGTQPEASYEGAFQQALGADGRETVYVSSFDGSVLVLQPGGEAWQLITPP